MCTFHISPDLHVTSILTIDVCCNSLMICLYRVISCARFCLLKMHRLKFDNLSWCLVCDDAVFVHSNNLFIKIRPRCWSELEPYFQTLVKS